MILNQTCFPRGYALRKAVPGDHGYLYAATRCRVFLNTALRNGQINFRKKASTTGDSNKESETFVVVVVYVFVSRNYTRHTVITASPTDSEGHSKGKDIVKAGFLAVTATTLSDTFLENYLASAKIDPNGFRP